MENHKIAIIGAGEIGKAINLLTKSAGCQTSIWDKEPGKTPETPSVEACVSGAEVIFLCVPSSAVADAVSAALSSIPANAIVVSLAKGIEEKEGRTMDELLAEHLPSGQKYALLSGPMLAEELIAGKGGSAVVAAKDPNVFEIIKAVFADSALRLEHSADVHSVALAGVLKNIYAVALGIASGLEAGDNAKGWIVGQATEEMVAILSRITGNTEAAYGTAGLADLVATGYSLYSHNNRAGQLLAKTGEIQKSEGLQALPFILKMTSDGAGLELLTALKAVVIEKQSAKSVFEQLIK